MMTDIKDVFGEEFKPDRYITKSAYTTSEPPRIGAFNKILEYGMRPPPVLPTNQLIRFPDATNLAKGKNNAKDGWAVYFEYQTDQDVVGVCVFGSWHGDPEQIIWSSKREQSMTPKEQREYHEFIEAAKEEQRRARAERHAKAKDECQQIIKGLPPLAGNPYTIKKKIKPAGAVERNGVIVLPITHNDEVVSLQYIDDQGNKRFHTGGRIKGGYLKLEGKDKRRTFICEGWSTGCSILEATKCTVYVAFNSGNLYDVCSYVKKNETGYICIAGDDDYEGVKNTGLEAAKKCHEVFGFDYRLPIFEAKDRGTDFNDMHQSLGLDAVDKHLALPKTAEREAKEEVKEDLPEIPPGVISDIYDYYMATSGNHQPGFALQTALALTSVAIGRYFITDEDNLSGLYFLNVANSATGKEHSKTIIDRIMRDVGWSHRVAGSGFTSGAAVMSMMLSKVVCITVIDEFGRYLETASSNKASLMSEANTMLMEVIGRVNGELRPKEYSTMTLNKDQKKDLKDREVICPSLTLVGLTTPSTFFDHLKTSSVLDGFLNRFIISVSDQPIQKRKRAKMFDTPDSIVDWFNKIKMVVDITTPVEVANERPNTIEVCFSKEALEVLDKFADEIVALRNDLIPIRLDGLPGRAVEFAQRLALILALSRNPETRHIDENDMRWACDYMRKTTHMLLQEVKDKVSDTYVEASTKEILSAIRDCGEGGITWVEMRNMKRRPFVKYAKKELEDILLSLTDGELIVQEQVTTSQGGRPTTKYTATPH